MNPGFPINSFDKKTGIVQVAQYQSGSPGEDYPVVYGDGSSLSGITGQCAGTKKRPVTSHPSTQCGLTMLSVTGNGSAIIRCQDETLTLRNGKCRVNVTCSVENCTPDLSTGSCTAEMITTGTIYHAGILENTWITSLS